MSIEVKGGKGGNGCISFESMRDDPTNLTLDSVVPSPSVRRPTGGNGGAGGNVFIIADDTLAHLSLQRAHFNAGNGSHGGGRFPLYRTP